MTMDDSSTKGKPPGKAVRPPRMPSSKPGPPPISPPSTPEDEGTVNLTIDDLQQMDADIARPARLPTGKLRPNPARRTATGGTPPPLPARGRRPSVQNSNEDSITLVDRRPARTTSGLGPAPASTPPPITPPPTTQKPAPEPPPPPASAPVVSLESGVGAPGEECEFYLREAAASAERQPERAAMMWIAAARATEYGNGDADTMVSQLQSALELAPSNPCVVPLVRRAMMSLRRYDVVLDLTDKLVHLGGENSTRAAALIEAAAVVYLNRGDGNGALPLLRRALKVQPMHTLALALQCAILLELGQHKQAAVSLEQLADTMETPEDRAACLYAAATIHQLRLKALDQSEALYQQAIEADPDNLPALLALAEQQQLEGQWNPLCRTLEQLAARVPETGGEAYYLLSAGSTCLDRTGDMEAAARALEAAASTAGEDPVPLSRLAYVYESTGHHTELVETLQRLLGLTPDTTGRAILLTRIGWLLQSRMHAEDQAIVAYRQALDALPGYLPALQALGTMYRRRKDFENLLSILRPEMEGTESAEHRAMRCVEVAEILDQQLSRPEEALEAYRRALDLVPGLPQAFWGMSLLLSSPGREAELAGHYARQIKVVADPKTRHHLLLELARLQAGVLDEPELAIQSLEEANGIQGNRSAAVRLVDLYRRSGRHADLAGLLLSQANDTKDPAEAHAYRVMAATILDAQLDEHDRALSILRDVLREHPRSIAATRVMGRIYHRLGRWQDLLQLHQQELKVDPDRSDAAPLMCRIGRIHEENLGQSAKAVEWYLNALERDPSSIMALEALERLARVEQRHDALAKVLERHASTSTEPFAAADALCRAAELVDAYLNDLPRAAELFREAVDRSPGFAWALHGLFNVRLRQGMVPQAVEVLDDLLAIAFNELETSYLTLVKARLAEFRLKQKPDLVLYTDAADSPLLASRLLLERIRTLRLVEGSDLEVGLVQLGGRIADSKLSAAHLLEAVYRAELARAQPADVNTASLAADRCDSDPAIIWAFQRCLRSTDQHAALAAMLEREAGLEAEPGIRLPLLAEASLAYLRAGQEQDAAKLARACLAHDPGHLPSLRLMATLAAQGQRWPELAGLYDKLSRVCQNPENRLQACLQAADLWAERADDPQQALSSLTLALTDDPDQAQAFDRAERLLDLLSDHAVLSQLYTRRIEVCQDRQEKVGLLARHAQLLYEQLGDTAQAIVELTTLLQLEPDNSGALFRLARWLGEEQRWSDTVEVLSRLVKQSPELSQRQSARLQQAHVWLEELHDPAQAGEILAQALEEEPQNLGAKRMLVQVAIAGGQWDEAARLLDEVAVEETPGLQVWAMWHHAEVARIGRRDDTLQRSYEQEALQLTLQNPELLDDIIQRFLSRGDARRLVEIGQQVVVAAAPGMDTTPLVMAISRVQLEQLNQPEQALHSIQEILVVNPEHREANLLAAQALERRGDMEGAVAGYRKLLQVDPTCKDAYRGLNSLMTVLGRPVLATSASAVLQVLDSPAQQPATLGPPPRGAGRIDPLALSLEPSMRPVREVLVQVLPYMGRIYPTDESGLLDSSHPAVLAAEQISQALGLSGVKLVLEGAFPARAGLGVPPVITVSSQAAGEPQGAAFRFWVSRALVCAAGAGALLERLSDGDMQELMEALFTARPLDPQVQQLRKMLLKALPRKARKQLEQLEQPPTNANIWSRYRWIESTRADQLALVLCGDPAFALRELAAAEGAQDDIAGSPRLCELMRFAVSADHDLYHRTIFAPA
jgi:tetratricopeptide (TPR) repeat protein